MHPYPRSTGSSYHPQTNTHNQWLRSLQTNRRGNYTPQGNNRHGSPPTSPTQRQVNPPLIFTHGALDNVMSQHVQFQANEIHTNYLQDQQQLRRRFYQTNTQVARQPPSQKYQPSDYISDPELKMWMMQDDSPAPSPVQTPTSPMDEEYMFPTLTNWTWDVPDPMIEPSPPPSRSTINSAHRVRAPRRVSIHTMINPVNLMDVTFFKPKRPKSKKGQNNVDTPWEFVNASLFHCDLYPKSEYPKRALPGLTSRMVGRHLIILVEFPRNLDYSTIVPALLYEKGRVLYPVERPIDTYLSDDGIKALNKYGEDLFHSYGLEPCNNNNNQSYNRLYRSATGKVYVEYICKPTVASSYYKKGELHFALIHQRRDNDGVILPELASTTFPVRILNKGFDKSVFDNGRTVEQIKMDHR